MAALRDFPILDRLQNSATRFLGVGTAAESAFALVVVHLPEATRQLILEDSLEFFQVYRGKSGCVLQKSSPAAAQTAPHGGWCVCLCPAFWLMSPVSRLNLGSMALSRVDLPAPEFPQKALVLSLSISITA